MSKLLVYKLLLLEPVALSLDFEKYENKKWIRDGRRTKREIERIHFWYVLCFVCRILLLLWKIYFVLIHILCITVTYWLFDSNFLFNLIFRCDIVDVAICNVIVLRLPIRNFYVSFHANIRLDVTLFSDVLCSIDHHQVIDSVKLKTFGESIEFRF